MSKFFIIVAFFSCVAHSKTGNDLVRSTDNKYLDFLKNFESSVDSIGDKLVTKYKSLSIVKEVRGEDWHINLRDKRIVSGSYNKYRYLMEIYDSTYLIISCVVGKSLSSGPDTFERDSIIVIDLNSGILSKASLPKAYLTRSRDFLFKAYKCPIDTLKYKEGYRYCAIDSIDIINRKLVVTNQCHQTEEFAMKYH